VVDAVVHLRLTDAAEGGELVQRAAQEAKEAGHRRFERLRDVGVEERDQPRLRGLHHLHRARLLGEGEPRERGEERPVQGQRVDRGAQEVEQERDRQRQRRRFVVREDEEERLLELPERDRHLDRPEDRERHGQIAQRAYQAGRRRTDDLVGHGQEPVQVLDEEVGASGLDAARLAARCPLCVRVRILARQDERDEAVQGVARQIAEHRAQEIDEVTQVQRLGVQVAAGARAGDASGQQRRPGTEHTDARQEGSAGQLRRSHARLHEVVRAPARTIPRRPSDPVRLPQGSRIARTE
jgi:hypothetical protein